MARILKTQQEIGGQEITQEGVRGIPGFALGAGKELIGGTVGLARGAQQLGQRVLAGVTPLSLEQVRARTGIQALEPTTPRGAGVARALKPRGRAERAGATTALIAELGLPVSLAAKTKLARGVARGARDVVKGTGGVIGEAIVGTKGRGVLRSAITKPNIQRRVLAGEITTKTIGDKIGKFAKSAQQKSQKKLEAARGKITGVEKGEIISKNVNTVMQKAIKDKPFSVEEERLVNKFITFIRKEIKPTGEIPKTKLDNLIRRIDDLGFFKGTDKFRNSDKVISSVRKTLRETTKEGNLEFAKLLEKAAKKDIPFFEKLGKNIVGKDGNINVDLLQNKINQLVKAIDDPNTRQGSLDLLRELARRSGAKADFIEELEVFSRSQPLLKDIPGISSPLETIKQLGTRGIARGLRIAGTIGKGAGAAREQIETGIARLRR